jgi:cellulose/xylan binding protein with CBM9 domain
MHRKKYCCKIPLFIAVISIFLVCSVFSKDKDSFNCGKFFAVDFSAIIYTDAEKCIDLGSSFCRIPVILDINNPEKNRFHLDLLDKHLKDLKKAKIEVLPALYCKFSELKDNKLISEENYEKFGELISETVRRFSKDIIYWEIPNLVNPGLNTKYRLNINQYSRLLKVAVRELKIVDKDCFIVGPSVFISKISFYEELYRNDLMELIDVLSVKYSTDFKNEDVFRKNLQEITLLLDRYGDSKRKIWLGTVSADPGWDIDLSISDKASGLVKSIMIAIESRRIERVFWKHNIILTRRNNDLDVKAYKVMSSLLKNMEYCGYLALEKNISAYLFKKGRKRTCVLWSSDGKRKISIPSSKNAVLVGFNGKKKELESVDGNINLNLTDMPVFITDLRKDIDPLKDFRFEMNNTFFNPGQKENFNIIVSNPLKKGILNGHIKFIAPEGIIIEPEEFDFTVKRKKVYQIPLAISVSKNVSPDFYTVEAFCDYENYNHLSFFTSYDIRIESHGKISLRGKELGKKKFQISTEFKNNSSKSLDGILRWDFQPRGKVQILPVPFYDLEPHDSITTSSGLSSGNVEARLIASIELENNVRIENGIGLMPMPFRMIAPKIDGYHSEWLGVPVMNLSPGLYSDIKSSDPEDLKDLCGRFQFWWTNKSFFFTAMIADDNSLCNPYRAEKIFLGDSVEIYFNLKDSSEPENPGDYIHLAISPGHKGRLPEMWDYTSSKAVENGKVVTSRTKCGYSIEAEIPMSSFNGWKPEHYTMIGFNLKLNDLDIYEKDKSFNSLLWSGSADTELSWGLAIIR